MKKIKIISIIALSTACIELTGCASSNEAPQPQILSSSLHSISKNSYLIAVSSTDENTARNGISAQVTAMEKQKNCQSYNVISSDISVESKVLNPELAEALAEQAPKFGIGYLAEEKRGLAIEAATPVPVYTYTSKVYLINCKTK